MSKKSILWLGCGDIATRALPALLAEKYAVTLVSRREKPVPQPAIHISADISDRSALSALLENKPDYIVLTLTPGGRTESDYRRAYYENTQAVIASLAKVRHQPTKIIFVSSTSVYHQQGAERVDENSHAQPTKATAQVLLETEELLRRSQMEVCIVRFSGIYGPGRYHLIKQVQAGIAGGKGLTNRIHAEDCAGVITFLIAQSKQGCTLPALILASDHCPVRADTVRSWLASQMGFPSTHLFMQSSQASARETNRACDSSLLCRLGYVFLYPSYKEGFASVLRQFKHDQQQ